MKQISVVINRFVNSRNKQKCEKNLFPTWYEHYTPETSSRLPALRKIKADSKVAASSFLPIISVSNMRSLLPKIRNFAEDMIMRNIQIALLCEIWEKDSNIRYQNEIERMLELNGLIYISCPRAGGRTGGGVGIVANSVDYTIKKLNIKNPDKVECVWSVARGKKSARGLELQNIVCASFYSPPNSRKNSKLTDHLISSVHYLQVKFPNSCIILGGDKNKLKLGPILDGLPGFQQIVTKVTYKDKILDVILTNKPQLFSNPITVPPVEPDDPNKGKPADHLTVIAIPLNKSENTTKREYVTKVVRPIPESGENAFSDWLLNQDWGWLEDEANPSYQVEIWEKLVEEQIDKICPSKTIKLSNKDKPFMTGVLKDEFRKLCRLYRKAGKSDQFKTKKIRFDRKYLKASKDYIKKNVDEAMVDNPGKATKALNHLSARPGDCQPGGSFRLVNHLEENLSIEESIEKFVTFFSSISQEFMPLDISQLPVQIQNAMIENDEIKPYLSENEVLDKFREMKKTKSSVPGDIPPKLRDKCKEELVPPVTKIFNNIIRTGIWPAKWKFEFGTPLPKNEELKDEGDTRIISITNHMSKLLEKFMFEWLMEFIGKHFDSDQFGAIKGSSITHYLIELVNFILFNQDLKDPKATLGMLVDLSKAFNRVDHKDVIVELFEMGTPGWLIKLVASFLSNRNLNIRVDGKMSTTKEMPGGGPQGTLLGLLIFIVNFNKAGSESSISNLGAHMNKPTKQRTPIENKKCKFVDDLTMLKSIDLKSKLRKANESNLVRPLKFHERTEHFLPVENNKMQIEMDDLQHFCLRKKMQINSKKTKVMIFNSKITMDFQPEVCLTAGNPLEVIEYTKLLGVMISSDMKWKKNTSYIIKKAYKRMWTLKRLKILGANLKQLKLVYTQRVRSVLEMAVPVWHPGLTISDKIYIERVQKSACHIILGNNYNTYLEALDAIGLEDLHTRREMLCKTFALKAVTSEKYSKWFSLNNKRNGKRRVQTKYSEIRCRTKRFEMSPIPYMTRLLNEIDKSNKIGENSRTKTKYNCV